MSTYTNMCVFVYVAVSYIYASYSYMYWLLYGKPITFIK